jgi:uncharacterized damage-inducible protein DinB
MTLQEIKILHAYNSWANNRIFDAVEQLPAAQYTQDLKSSHRSVHGTLTHLVAAEKMWLSRWLGTPDPKYLAPDDFPTIRDLRKVWESIGYETARFLGGLSDRKLQETFTMTTSSGETFTHTYTQAVQHVVDHSSYHRGQIVAMLRQLGVQPPPTGLIRFYREISKVKTP